MRRYATKGGVQWSLDLPESFAVQRQLASIVRVKVETMLDFAQLHPQVLEHLPIAKEIKKLSRAYLGNVIYTIVGKPFKDWVDGKIKERHAKVKEQQDMLVSLDPDIARIFAESTAVSVSKGSSHHLMKASAQRRRTTQ